MAAVTGRIIPRGAGKNEMAFLAGLTRIFRDREKASRKGADKVPRHIELRCFFRHRLVGGLSALRLTWGVDT